MSHHGRQRQSSIPRPESRGSQYSGYSGQSGSTGGGRFTHALSAALKRDDYSRPPLPPQTAGTSTITQAPSNSPEEQLEEVEQKITLTLQAIDANFDHCQRTMARDMMPKVERLAKLSSELLQASQPWLQFFMAVAAADEDVSDEASQVGSEARVYTQSEYSGELVDDEETRHASLGPAQRAAIEEQAYKGDITARFPTGASTRGNPLSHRNGNDDDNDDDDSSVDIDAEIATPQLTSRFMTEELAMASGKRQHRGGMREPVPSATPATPRVRNLKRMAEQLSVSAKKRKVGTPAKGVGNSGAPKTPLSMMRALVNAKQTGGGTVGFGRIPGSAASYASKNSSSMGTDDLMPDTSPPHTTTFTLPQSRRIAPAKGPTARLAAGKGKGAAGEFDQFGFGEDDDNDDILDEINSLINRYDSPKSHAAPSSVVTASKAENQRNAAESAERPASAATSNGASLAEGDREYVSDMKALADKYASPAVADTVVKVEEAVRMSSLVADMEEMLDEAEAIARGSSTSSPGGECGNGSAKKEPENGNSGEYDDFDDIPSPPQPTSDLSGSRVVISATTATTTTTTTTTAAAAATAPADPRGATKPQVATRTMNQPRRTAFGAGRNMIRMDIEEMDNENMTIGHMSPLANRGRQPHLASSGVAANSGSMRPTAATAVGSRFHTLGMDGEDDPFGPTPERSTHRPTAMRGSRQAPPQSAQSERPIGGSAAVAAGPSGGGPQSARSWSSHPVNSRGGMASSAALSSRSNTMLGSDATGTLDSPGVESVGGDREVRAGDSQLNESSLTIDNNDYTGGFSQTIMDGTTTILPTREMLQQAAQVAEDAEAQQQSREAQELARAGPADSDGGESDEDIGAFLDDDEDGGATRNSSISAASHTQTAPLVEYSPDIFPPAFRSPPASLQLKGLYDLIRSRDQHIWSLEDIAAASASSDVEELQNASESVYAVLLDLLSRRRLVRKVAEGLWSAH